LFSSFGFAPYVTGVAQEIEIVAFYFWLAAVCGQSEGFQKALHAGRTPRNIGSLVDGC
jgi:hypothetical protein